MIPVLLPVRIVFFVLVFRQSELGKPLLQNEFNLASKSLCNDSAFHFVIESMNKSLSSAFHLVSSLIEFGLTFLFARFEFFLFGRYRFLLCTQ